MSDLKSYLDTLISRDTIRSTVPDPAATGRNGHPVMRCPSCGYALVLGIEQFCPSCGQRFVRDGRMKEWAEEYQEMTARTLKEIYGERL